MIGDYYPAGYVEPDFDFRCKRCRDLIHENDLVQEPTGGGSPVEFDWHFECYMDFREDQRIEQRRLVYADNKI
jgi:hypothetical protein